MRAREAAQLFTGQSVELNDGRLATVQMQDTANKQVRLQFQDGSVGTLGWADFFTIELAEGE